MNTALVAGLKAEPVLADAFAAFTAAPISETRVIAATGPNVSSSKAGMPSVTLVSTVGG